MREKKKKMYLLAMAILLINTTSFGANYNSYNGQESKDPNKYGNEKEQTKEVNPVKTKDVGIMLTSGDNKSLKVTNKVDTVVDGGTGVKTNIYKDKDGDPEKNPLGNGKNLFINEGNITINGGIGVDLYAPDKIKGENRFENNGTLTVNSGTGVKLGSINGSVINNKDIIVKGGVGVSLLKNGVSFTNNNNLTVSNGTGIQFDKTGTVGAIFVNSGNVIATNGIAVNNIGSGNATTYLKNGSTTVGTIQGSTAKTPGVDILALEGGDKSYKDLDVKNYNAITVRGGEAKIEDSKIELYYNNKTEKYLTSTKNELNKVDGKKELGNLTISNSSLTIGMNGDTNKLIDAKEVNLKENVSLKFQGAGQGAYDVSKILGANVKFDINNFEDTVIWKYKNQNGKLIANKKDYFEILNKSQLKDFTAAFQNDVIKNKKIYEIAGDTLESIKTEGEFNKALTQLSGGLHGYTVDIAAVNSRTLSNTIKNRALTRDYLVSRPVSSWIQDVSYIDNNHKFGGLMDVDYREKGAFGISEKQILKNGRLGIVYGGSTGKADAREYGDIDVDAAYFGGYYHHTFNDNWSLNSNANFVYTHNRVTRNINFGEGKDSINHQFKSNYPTYTVGIGSKLIYTLKDDNYNRAYFYTGLDINRIMQGMINEEEDKSPKDAPEFTVRKGNANDKSYYSIVPSAGFMVQNSGYIFDKKYRIGADFAWETELGHIKDGKRIDMKGISREYKVETTERENIFSYSILGELNLTEDLAVNARYTSMFSDEYDADLVSAGFEYKMDTMGKNLIAPLFYGLENNKPDSDRWGGTFGLVMETLDDTDRAYYNGGKLSGGDYATSTIYKPKFTLSLNDKKTARSYYFEGYYQNNEMIQGKKSNEAKMHASRIHGEARWTDTYSKGKYGINIGYRHEEADKPQNFGYPHYRRTKRKVHQLRLTPNFTYELGNGFTFTGKTTGVLEYNYEGDRESQMDFLMENEYGIIYTGITNWRMSLIYFRDDRWYDNSNRKVEWDSKKKEYKYNYDASGRYQLGQIRPTIIYYFGNGGSFKFDVRVPLGNGQWYQDKKGKKSGGETYEVRYGFNYYHPVTPGVTLNLGGAFLNIKSKAKNGDITRSYSFRPNIGISYSF